MIRRPIQEYFFFGTAVRYLQDADEGYRILDFGGGWAIRANLQNVLQMMDRLNLRVSLQTKAAGRIRALLAEFETATDSQRLSAEQAKKLGTDVRDLRETLEAELKATFAYSLLPKRIDISLLLDDPGALFAPGVFAKLPAIAQADISDAGRCIAFELPTAAAFHLMRATEAVLRDFYRVTVLRGRRARMWGEIVADIRGRRVGKRYAVLLNHLDHIRSAFRNPTQHPEAKYDIHEVQDLWSVAADAINRMAAVL